MGKGKFQGRLGCVNGGIDVLAVYLIGQQVKETVFGKVFFPPVIRLSSQLFWSSFLLTGSFVSIILFLILRCC
jgi:hypothetical protein